MTPRNDNKKIPGAAIPRLSVYYRVLEGAKDIEYISSGELSRLTTFAAAQIRRDLAYFGQFGTSGKGYEIAGLKSELLKILGIDRERVLALVGAGNLGLALLAHKGFKKQGFTVKYVFDNDPHKIGEIMEGVEILDAEKMADIISENQVYMAILATDTKNIQNVVNLLVNSGVKAILNFVPVRPKVPASVKLLNIDLTIELEKLAYFLSKSPPTSTIHDAK